MINNGRTAPRSYLVDQMDYKQVEDMFNTLISNFQDELRIAGPFYARYIACTGPLIKQSSNYEKAVDLIREARRTNESSIKLKHIEVSNQDLV